MVKHLNDRIDVFLPSVNRIYLTLVHQPRSQAFWVKQRQDEKEIQLKNQVGSSRGHLKDTD